jgi:hypothetical protein
MIKWLIDSVRRPRTVTEEISKQRHVPIIDRDENDFLMPMPIEFVKCPAGEEEMILRIVEGWPNA